MFKVDISSALFFVFQMQLLFTLNNFKLLGAHNGKNNWSFPSSFGKIGSSYVIFSYLPEESIENAGYPNAVAYWGTYLGTPECHVYQYCWYS